MRDRSVTIIMKNNGNNMVAQSPGPGAGRTAVYLALYLLLVFLLAAVTAAAVVAWARGGDGGPREILRECAPGRVTRRCLVLWAAVFLPALLKRCGWRGWRDAGLTISPGAATAPGPAARFAAGLGLGLLLLGILSVVDVLAGARCIDAALAVGKIPGRFIGYGLSALVIALIEETVCRGLLFRTFSRSWGAFAAALVTSAIFAFSHFIDPAPACFNAAPLPVAAMRILVGMFTRLPEYHHLIIRFLNLTLLGCALCAFVARTGTVWFSIGLHLGCVWVMKMNGFLTDTARPLEEVSVWLGQRSDVTDGLAGTAVILAMLAGAFWRRRRRV